MKNILSLWFICAFAQCSFSPNIQHSVSTGTQSNLLYSNSIDKNAANERPIYINDISTRAVRDLKLTFKTVTDEKWCIMPYGYQANFVLNNNRYRIDYDVEGNWLQTVHCLDEKKWPTEVRRLVVCHYLDYTIKEIEEVEVPRVPEKRIFYAVHLQGQTNWIIVKVCDYEINEIAKGQ